MRLTTGITQWLPQWELVLGQIGVPAEEITTGRSASTDSYVTIIVTRQTGQSEKDALLHYLEEGGSILTEADTAEWLLGIKTLSTYVRYVEPDGDSIFDGVMPGFIDASLPLPSEATALECDSGKKLVRVIRHGKGYVLILPGSICKTVLDTKVRRRNFPTQGPRLPSERVSRRSKHTIREIVHRSLEYLTTVRGLPFVSLWPFPDGAQTLFNFRVDTDYASHEQVESLYELSRQFRIPCTWFVETQSSQDWTEKYAKMENQEIGLHCFRHRVFSDFIRNEREIKAGTRILQKEGIRPSGYAAPFGQWNVSLAKAIEHHGFIYSSEFALDYDNLPFHPYLTDRFSTVIQMPIHPIATSHLRNAHHSEEQMMDYFRDLMELCITHRLPLFIYDHPSNANPKALNWVFRTVREREIRTATLREYARWWSKRADLKWNASLDEDTLILGNTPQDSSFWVSIRKSDSQSTVVEMKDRLDLNSLTWQKPEETSSARTPIRLRASMNRKMMVNEILHFYWKHRL